MVTAAALLISALIAALVAVAHWGDVATIGSTAVAILGAIGAAVFMWPYFRGKAHAGMIAEKDEIIRTNEQTIEAFEKRIGGLEQGLITVNSALQTARAQSADLQAQLDKAVAQYKDLEILAERYSAPAAVQRFEKALVNFGESNETLLNNVLERMTALENKHCSHH